MDNKNQNINSLIPYKSDILIRVTNTIEITNKLFNELAQFYLIRGKAKFNNKDYGGAIADLTKAIELNPNNSETHLIRGNAKMAIPHPKPEQINTEYYLDKFCGVLKDYQKAIELNPNNPNYYITRGRFCLSTFQYNQAITDFSKAIEMNPSDANLYLYRGKAKYFSWYTIPHEVSKLNDAIEDFNKGIDLNPNVADLFYYRGEVKNEQHDYIGAIENYSKAIQINPTYFGYFQCRGWAECKINDYRAAVDDFNSAIKLGSPNVGITFWRDRSLELLNNLNNKQK